MDTDKGEEIGKIFHICKAFNILSPIIPEKIYGVGSIITPIDPLKGWVTFSRYSC